MPVRLVTPPLATNPAARAVIVVAALIAACAPHPGPPRAHLAPAPVAAAAVATRPARAANAPRASAGAASPASAGRLSRAALLRSAPADTYILDVLMAQQFEVVRWPEHVRAPIRVWIADGSQLEGWRPTFPAVVESAFSEWCALGIPVRVAFVADSARADVRVHWVDHFGQDVSGRTTWQYDDAGLIRAGRTTLSTRRADGTKRTEAQLRAIALHEAGHALGLQHAEDDETSIMAPRVDALGLSDADRATVRLLYALPAGKLQ